MAPATDDHLVAAQALHEQVLAHRPPETLVFTEGPRWNPTGAERPSYVPDVSVVDRRALRRARGVYTLSPAPLLVVEVISPESRRRDVGEKADAYFAGGALAYWTVDIPSLTGVPEPEVTLWRRGAAGWERTGPLHGMIAVNDPFDVRIDLHALVL